MTEASQQRGRAIAEETQPSASAGATFQGTTRVEGTQTSPLDAKALAAAHKQRQEVRRLDHELAETTKDNDARRHREKVMFWVVISAMIVGFAGGIGLALLTTDPGNRELGRSLVLIVVGALGGYLSAKKLD